MILAFTIAASFSSDHSFFCGQPATQTLPLRCMVSTENLQVSWTRQELATMDNTNNLEQVSRYAPFICQI